MLDLWISFNLWIRLSIKAKKMWITRFKNVDSVDKKVKWLEIRILSRIFARDVHS